MKLFAAPGIAIIVPIEEKSSGLVTSDKQLGRVHKGKIIAMGRNIITDFNALLEADWYGKVGDTVYFMHYYDEGGVDYGVIDGEKHFFVKWQDIRGVVQS